MDIRRIAIEADLGCDQFSNGGIFKDETIHSLSFVGLSEKNFPSLTDIRSLAMSKLHTLEVPMAPGSVWELYFVLEDGWAAKVDRLEPMEHASD